jgi:hypothetical protein
MKKSKLIKALKVIYSIDNVEPLDYVKTMSDTEILAHFTTCGIGECNFSYLLSDSELLEEIIEVSNDYHDFLGLVWRVVKDHVNSHEDISEEQLE